MRRFPWPLVALLLLAGPAGANDIAYPPSTSLPVCAVGQTLTQTTGKWGCLTAPGSAADTVTAHDGTGTVGSATTYARGDHAHGDANRPSDSEKAALAGTSGTPGTGNRYVTDGDARNSDVRTPSAHATTHTSGGSDAVKLDALAAPTDVTTLNATTSAHGLLPKLTGSTTDFLRADGTYAAPPSGVAAGLIAFAAGDCPSGWSEYTAARGFAIVGLPANGTVAGTVGTAFTDQQDTSASLTHAGTAVDDHASHTHTYTEVPNHVHGVSTILRTATTGGATTQVTNAQDTSSTADTTRKTDNPTGGVATGTTAGPSATLTHAVTQPSAHTISTSQVLGYIQLRACAKD